MVKKRKKEKRKERSSAVNARKRAEEHKGMYENTKLNLPEGVKMFSLDSEKTKRIDILNFEVGKDNPYADEGTLHYERTFFVHRNIGADQLSFVCPRKTSGGKDPCPICEFITKLRQDEDADVQLIKDMGLSERQLFNVIDHSEKDAEVRIWDMSFFLFGKRLDKQIKEEDDDDNFSSFAEFENGLTLKLGVEEVNLGRTTFYAVSTINFKERKEDYDEEEMLEQVYNLDELLNILDYDELNDILLQTTEDEDEKSGKKKKKKKDEDEDNGEDEDNREDEGEDEEATIEVDSEVMFEDDEGDSVTGVVKSIRGKKATIITDDDEKVKINLDDLTLTSEDFDEDFDEDGGEDEGENEGEDAETNGTEELAELTKKDDNEDFEEYSGEITERCEEEHIDPDDFDTWKEAELAVRKATSKKKSKKKTSKKSKKKGKSKK